MMTTIKPPLVLIALIVCINSTAQSFVGHNLDNYAGIHGVILNPANAVGSNFKAEINLVSISSILGSDYISLSTSAVAEGYEDFDFQNANEVTIKENNQFFTNLDVLGPSFMFNLSPKSSIAFTTRARAFGNFNNINGELFETVIEDFDDSEDFDFDVSNFNGTASAWAEVGLTYGRILHQADHVLLKAGATIKYLQGAGSTFLQTPDLTGRYNATAETLTTTGQLQYGNTLDGDDDLTSFEFQKGNSGFGADIGISLEFINAKKASDTKRQHNDYTLKLAASITDLGKVTYERVTVYSYDMNASIGDSNFEEDFEEALADSYQGTETTEDINISLPTALHLQADYRLASKWYVSAMGTVSLTDDSEAFTHRVLNTLVLAPRLETKWFSLYSPVSFRQYEGVAWGAGLRLGPLHVGSGSILTNLLTESSKTVDVFAGLKIPIYRK